MVGLPAFLVGVFNDLPGFAFYQRIELIGHAPIQRRPSSSRPA